MFGSIRLSVSDRSLQFEIIVKIKSTMMTHGLETAALGEMDPKLVMR